MFWSGKYEQLKTSYSITSTGILSENDAIMDVAKLVSPLHIKLIFLVTQMEKFSPLSIVSLVRSPSPIPSILLLFVWSSASYNYIPPTSHPSFSSVRYVTFT